MLDVERHIVEQYRSVGIYSLQSFHFENLVARLALHLEDDAGVLAARRAYFLDVELLEHLLARGGLLRLGHIGREAAYELLQLLAFLLSLHALVLSLAQGQLTGLVPEGVVTREYGHLAKVDVHGLCRDGIEEVTVVAHHEDALLQRAQVLLQPLHGVQVEVVGGLVEQQVVGMAEQCLGQHDAHLLVVREFRHLFVVLSLLHAKVLQQLGSLAFSLPAVHLGKLQLEVGGTVAIFLGHLGLGIQGLALLHVLPEWLVSHEHGVHDRKLVVLEVVLREHREAFARAQLHGTLVGLQLAADGFQQRRLAGSVGTDDAVDVSTRKLDVHVFVKDSFSKLDS